MPVVEAKGAGLVEVVFPEEPTWAQGDFECGDVLTFHSHTVHQGLPNTTDSSMRLSMDCRAQPRADQLIAPVSLDSPHLHPVDWDGRDDRGMEVGSGVYLARLTVPGDQESPYLKLALVR